MSKNQKLYIKKYFIFLIKTLTFFLFVYFFFNFINQKYLLSSLTKFTFEGIFIIYLLFLILPILLTLRWFIVVKNFSKMKFIELLKNIISGLSFSLIFSTALATDATKFIKLKKEIGYQKSLILVSIDKFSALFLKIFFVYILIIFYLYFYTQVSFYYILFLVFIYIFLLLVFSKIDQIIIFLYKKYLIKKKKLDIESILKKTKKDIIKLIVVNLLIQLLNICIYFLIFFFLQNNLTFFKLSVFVPMVELLAQFSFLVFGVREISTVYLLGFFSIEKELALASALIYLFINYLVIITFYASLKINRINFFKKKNIE